MKYVKVILVIFIGIGIISSYLLDREFIKRRELIENDIEDYALTLKKIEEYNTFLTSSSELLEEYSELNAKISELEEEKSKLESDISTANDELSSLS